MIASSIPAVLRERASLQPNETAFTFTNYEQDWDGVAETLTWAQLYKRTVNFAEEVVPVTNPGDRAVIVAPQGLEYLIAFLGSMQAGLVAVPLSTPMVGAHDERVSAVLRDAAPTTVLTTSAIANTVVPYVQSAADRPAPAVIEVDRLDLDTRRKTKSRRDPLHDTAYLQYTSGSTRAPAGVMVSYRNLAANFEQMMADFYPEFGKVSPPGTTAVSWLPFYHDMGLLLGIAAPILGGWQTMFTTPLSFLARPARWAQTLAGARRAITASPNFAFDLTSAKTSDADMAGLDLGDVAAVMSGAERVHEATLKRFTQRFAKFGLRPEVVRPSYGLAEATLYVATREPGRPATVVHFEPEKLSDGQATRTDGDTGTPLVSYGAPESPRVRIVDPETRVECVDGLIGEIWVQGDNVCLGYWQKPEQTEHTFGGQIVEPSPATPEGPWLRTGDLGFISEGELFIIGRIKDLLIVRGRNHYPDDIEATIQEVTGGRVAAIAVEEHSTEQLVAIIEVKKRGDSDEEVMEKLQSVKNEVTTAISRAHGLSPADLVLVARGSIPITTSGKIRRAACGTQYRAGSFARLDA